MYFLFLGVSQSNKNIPVSWDCGIEEEGATTAGRLDCTQSDFMWLPVM